MRASTSISISLTFCNCSGVSTARMSCETWARCTARSDSSEATFAACARMAVSSMVSAWMASRKTRRSVTTSLMSGPTVGWYWRRMVFNSAFCSDVTPSCFSLSAKRPLLKPTSLVVSACARKAKKPPTVRTMTAPAAINTLVCVFILLYPFHPYKTRARWKRLRKFRRERRRVHFASGSDCDLQFCHRRAVAPLSHEELLRSVAQRVLAMGTIERCIGETVEKLPGAVEVERIDGAGGRDEDIGGLATRFLLSLQHAFPQVITNAVVRGRAIGGIREGRIGVFGIGSTGRKVIGDER